jgi:hypothetical protein
MVFVIVLVPSEPLLILRLKHANPAVFLAFNVPSNLLTAKNVLIVYMFIEANALQVVLLALSLLKINVFHVSSHAFFVTINTVAMAAWVDISCT